MCPLSLDHQQPYLAAPGSYRPQDGTHVMQPQSNDCQLPRHPHAGEGHGRLPSGSSAPPVPQRPTSVYAAPLPVQRISSAANPHRNSIGSGRPGRIDEHGEGQDSHVHDGSWIQAAPQIYPNRPPPQSTSTPVPYDQPPHSSTYRIAAPGFLAHRSASNPLQSFPPPSGYGSPAPSHPNPPHPVAQVPPFHPRSSSCSHSQADPPYRSDLVLQPSTVQLPLHSPFSTNHCVPSSFPPAGSSISSHAPRSLNTSTEAPTPFDMLAQQHHSLPSSSSVSSTSTAIAPPITYPVPTIDGLGVTLNILHTLPDSDKLAWAQDVLRVLEKHVYPNGLPTDFCSTDAPQPHLYNVTDGLKNLVNQAIPIIISFTTHHSPDMSAMASYLKAKLLSSGMCPDFLPRDPRQAFKDFETAARGGDIRGWYRLGRDYEGVGDLARAKDCFERGLKKGDCECAYRLGMAHLMGQLDILHNAATALHLLQTAASGSTIDAPHPSFVYGMVLSGELLLPPHLPAIPPHVVLTQNSPASDAFLAQQQNAREAIERAAYLCHPPAQQKMGQLYEHAMLGIPYDPLMSVQWHSLAAQNGDAEADMALSKWFLCGAEGHFAKNDQLARTFAEKAAKKGLPNGCFAMGYYHEAGVGGKRDPEQARKWYQKAARLGNTDAPARLAALSAPNPALISITEHQTRLNDTLVRKHTAAKIRSDRFQGQNPNGPQPPGARRRRAEAERARIEADRAARGVPGYQHPGPPRNFMSPAPRPGEVMSPGVMHPAMMAGGNGSFPRPPIPHQAFSTASSNASSSASGGGNADRRRYTLQDGGGKRSEADLEQQRREREKAKMDNGPQTFAEMGFVSKPVEDEGCTIM